MRGVSKFAEPVNLPAEVGNVMRRAMSAIRNGRSGPAIVEIPTDIWNEEIGDLDYTPVGIHKFGPDPVDVRKAAAAILGAKRPVIYAGTGVHWAEAWAELRGVRRAAGGAGHHQPGRQVVLPGESSAVAARLRRNAVPKPVHDFVTKADVIIGIGCSFTETNFGIKFPRARRISRRRWTPIT